MGNDCALLLHSDPVFEGSRAAIIQAAYIINGGSSDDGFCYFRAWLIGQGQKTYEAAVKDPQILASIVEGEIECELLLASAHDVYRELTGKEMPLGPTETPEPRGVPWEEDQLNQRFPLLAEKFGGGRRTED